MKLIGLIFLAICLHAVFPTGLPINPTAVAQEFTSTSTILTTNSTVPSGNNSTSSIWSQSKIQSSNSTSTALQTSTISYFSPSTSTVARTYYGNSTSQSPVFSVSTRSQSTTVTRTTLNPVYPSSSMVKVDGVDWYLANQNRRNLIILIGGGFFLTAGVIRIDKSVSLYGLDQNYTVMYLAAFPVDYEWFRSPPAGSSWIKSAADWARSSGYATVSVIGVSAGAAVVAHSATLDPGSFDTIVLIGLPNDTPEGAAPTAISAPIIFISGLHDSVAPPATSANWYSRVSSNVKQLRFVNSDHDGLLSAEDTTTGIKTSDMVLAWLRRFSVPDNSLSVPETSNYELLLVAALTLWLVIGKRRHPTRSSTSKRQKPSMDPRVN